jgi:2-(1,2-epoxy-1,2-dihydrophenyl)acetyl-CoA isomerase
MSDSPAALTAPTVAVDAPRPGVRRLTLTGTSKMNAVDRSLRLALGEALETALDDASVRALVITGAGQHFSAGGDIGSMDSLTLEAARARMRSVQRVTRALITAEKPVVSAINGAAVGAGGSIAIAADLAIAGEGAKIGFPFFRIGLVPDWGCLYSLPRRIGPAKARNLWLTGRIVAAEEALDLGLVDEVVADDALAERAVDAAAELAALPQMAFGLAKRQWTDPAQSLDAALEMEARAQAACFLSEDAREGRASFFAKRGPDFGTVVEEG